MAIESILRNVTAYQHGYSTSPKCVKHCCSLVVLHVEILGVLVTVQEPNGPDTLYRAFYSRYFTSSEGNKARIVI